MSSNFTFKLVLLGDGRVWKTSLVLRYVITYSPRSKKPQTSFLFYKAPSHCAAALLVYDITYSVTFLRVRKWVKELQQMTSKDIVTAIEANKNDLVRSKNYGTSTGAKLFVTSAKSGTGVDEVFLDIATRGTGNNLTPPPATIISDEAFQACNRRIEIIANTLELEGFSRIDAFVNVHNGEDLVIEVNTIPRMIPSTVLIHQALAELPPIRPQEFFRTVLDLALRKSK